MRISKRARVFSRTGLRRSLEHSLLSWGVWLPSRTGHRDRGTHVGALQVPPLQKVLCFAANEPGEVPAVRSGAGEEQEWLLL